MFRTLVELHLTQGIGTHMRRVQVALLFVISYNVGLHVIVASFVVVGKNGDDYRTERPFFFFCLL